MRAFVRSSMIATIGFVAVSAWAEARSPHHFAPTLSVLSDAAIPFGLNLTQWLESPTAPELPVGPHEAALPARFAMTGVLHGAMLDRCRSRMRSVTLIGHGASPDGRPEACRLLSFVGKQRAREAPALHHDAVRVRFAQVAPPPAHSYAPSAAHGAAPLMLAGPVH